MFLYRVLLYNPIQDSTYWPILKSLSYNILVFFPSIWIHFWNFSSTNIFAFSSNFAASSLSSQIFYSLATFFTSIIYFFFGFFFFFSFFYFFSFLLPPFSLSSFTLNILTFPALVSTAFYFHTFLDISTFPIL